MRTMRAQFSSLRSLSRLSHATPRSLSIQPRLRAQRSQFRPFSSSFQRFNSASDPAPGQPQKSRLVEEPEGPQPPTPERAPQPSYDLTFTCTPCGTRSTHRISKQGYHHGSVLIACPGCRNRHVISDHLNIFGNKKMTIEDLMKERGQLVKKGTLSEDGDLEFWEDGTTTKRAKKEDDVAAAGTEGQGKLE